MRIRSVSPQYRHTRERAERAEIHDPNGRRILIEHRSREDRYREDYREPRRQEEAFQVGTPEVRTRMRMRDVPRARTIENTLPGEDKYNLQEDVLCTRQGGHVHTSHYRWILVEGEKKEKGKGKGKSKEKIWIVQRAPAPKELQHAHITWMWKADDEAIDPKVGRWHPHEISYQHPSVTQPKYWRGNEIDTNAR